MSIKTRIYNDFFRPSKEEDYEIILKTAKENGYEFHTQLSFLEVLKNGLDPQKNYLILRRDVDTADYVILRKMLCLEKKYGARATYYFRWNTMNLELMNDINKSGGEASYHYEEIATFCYRNHIRSREQVLKKMEEIRDLFIVNIKKFREKTKQPCLTVASHGDYINSRLKIQNKELLNERVRLEAGVLFEAYDELLASMITCRLADQIEMNEFAAKAINAIEQHEPLILLLTHPRQWNSPVGVNLKENINRFMKGIYMNF